MNNGYTIALEDGGLRGITYVVRHWGVEVHRSRYGREFAERWITEQGAAVSAHDEQWACFEMQAHLLTKQYLRAQSERLF